MGAYCSAVVSLGLLEIGAVPKVTIVERDPLLFSFWSCVFEHTEEIIGRFLDLPITLETWHQFSPLLKIDSVKPRDVIKLGLAGLFFNRANFSGILHGGPIGGFTQESEYKIDCRSNQGEIVARIMQLAQLAPYVTVKFGDGLQQIKKDLKKKRVLYYVDPPYFEMGRRLYRYYFKLRDHKQLAETLKKAQFPWVLSYDRNHVIEFLYDGCDVRKHGFHYSARSRKRESELVIASFKLPAHLV